MKVREASEGSGGPTPDEGHLRGLAQEVRRRFYEAMDDDLNTPPAARAVLELARAVNGANHISPQLGEELVLEFCDFCSVLGLCEEEFDSKEQRSLRSGSPGL
jgi:cysteinyl-tRNA synthetase